MRIGVVLFNLGGPDSQEAVLPYLLNLFSDPAIIRLPQPFRWLIAQIIARRRAPIARRIYAELGGGSPLMKLTLDQANALEGRLVSMGHQAKVVVAMRYWRPRAEQAFKALQAFAPERIVLLPLYPQFSTATTASSLKDWHEQSGALGFPSVSTICCYPDLPNFVAAHAELIKTAIGTLPQDRPFRVLFSAHGLPEQVIKTGDPYAWQVSQTARSCAAKIGLADSDWRVCYQSRVGPLKWTGPSTNSEIKRAGRDGISLVVVPIAFVSEHSETLVELDVEARDMAVEAGVPHFVRVPSLGVQPLFVDALAQAVMATTNEAPRICPAGHRSKRLCPAEHSQCPVKLA